MRSIWAAGRLVLRRAGVRALLTQVLRWSLRRVVTWHTLVFFERNLADDIPHIRARIPLEMRVLDAEELPEYRPALEAAGLEWAEVQARAARGDRCTVGLSQGRLVHMRWITVAAAWIPELRALIVPQPGEAYVYNSYTPEETRGSEVQPAISCLMVQWGRRQGYRRHLFYVLADNPSGLRIVEKLGARKTGAVRCVWLRGLGAWFTGLDTWKGPRLDFGDDASVRRLGPLGLWVRQRCR